MAQQSINLGAAPNDGTGDTLRVGGQKIEANFTELYAAVAGISGGGSSGAPLRGVASGCVASYSGAGLTWDMSAGSFYIDGTLYTAAAQSVTLNAADATHPRIDALYVDDAGVFGKITGTAAAAPSRPTVDPTTQLELTFVLVPATATNFNGVVTTETIYDEGSGEWSGTTSGSGFTVDSTNNPNVGTKCIEGTTVSSGSYVKFADGSPSAFGLDGNLLLSIRSKAAWNAKRSLVLQFYRSGVAVGQPITLKEGSYGFSSGNTSSYQALAIPKSQFAIASSQIVDEFRITAAGSGGSAIGFYVDPIKLQTNGSATTGGVSSGMTQAEADARFLQRSNNLSDVSDAAAARTNIGAAARTPAIQAVASAATVTPTFADDQVNITAQAAGLTLANPTGTAVDGWGISIRIKDNGTARGILYGSQYREIGVTLPTTTVINKTLYLGMIYNAADTKWDVVAVAQEA